MTEMSPVERRLRFVAKAQIAMGVVVVGGMFVIIGLLSFALVRANQAIRTTEALTQDNCFNIEASRNYFDSLDRTLTAEIRKAAPGTDLALIRKLVDQARLASASMILTNCQEAQG